MNNESTTDSDGIARFVYRMDKDTLSDEPVRLQFTDDAGNKYTSDDFQPNADKLFTEYTMGIYPGAVDQGKVNAQIVIDGEVKETLDAAVTDGTLTVRGTNDETTVTVPVGNDESSVSDNTNVVDEATGTTITAISQEGTSYHINDSQVAVDAGDVSLLADSLLENKEPLETYLQEKNYATAESNIQFQYLDLVQPKNGNAQVTADQPMTIYWKAPKNADLDKDFTLVHFEGLDRDYTGEGVVSDEETHVYSTKQDLIDASSAEKLEKVELDGATYLKFTTQTFSPFALIWEEKESSNPDPGPGPSPTEFVLHYESNGGTPYADESYKANTVVELDKTPSRQGYIFTGWYSDEDLQNKITSVKMTSDKTVYAGWEATDVPGDLNGEDHFAYVFGYEDGNVRPNRNITRAEVASIFFRLLNEDVREENLTADNDFSDVSADAWYNIPVSTMAKMGIVKGRTADEFAPDAPITRAEFAAIASRFDTSDIQPDSTFTDISGHWAEEAIERAATIGWIMGYEDNTFRPENNITRAESMATINRVLKRLPENESDLLDEMHHWPDNQPGSWYYLAVQEATNGHDYERKADGVHEKWTAMREH